ncbi:hypothetical protein [Hymenobacter terrenus]|uniref:hypothetical protein n=1 Tax=Hymenobacter terrenus TaxID=1629124 RepID=UPI0006199697|nr:hypothetical protein [Hymenobacter terrenus]
MKAYTLKSCLRSTRKGKRTLALLVALPLAPLAVQAQAPAWQKAVSVAVNNNFYAGTEGVTATAADASGNVYLVGSFSGTATFGNITVTSTSSTGNSFVAKWSPANGFLWAKSISGASANAVAVSGASVYVAGTFFGTTEFGTTRLASLGISDAFVFKLTDAGSSASFAWAQRAGGSSIDNATAVAVNGTNVYVTGGFSSIAADFGSTTLANSGPNSNRNLLNDVFIAKLTDAGTSASFAWAQRAGGTGPDTPAALAVNGTSIYVAGQFNGNEAGFGGTILASANTNNDVFVAKLTDAGASGSFAWAQRAGGTGYDAAKALAVSGTNVYIAGEIASPTAAFGGTSLISTGSSNAFVAKLTDVGASGNFTWAQRAGGAGANVARALAVRGADVYVAGAFSGSAADFGRTKLASFGGNTSIFGGDDVFVAKLTDAGASGSFAWAQRAGDAGADAAEALTLSGGTVYVTGSFAGSKIAFGSTVLTKTSASSTDGSGFLAALTDVASTQATTALLVDVAPHPNPAQGATAVTLPAGSQARLVLTNAMGRVVRVQNVKLSATEPTTAQLSLAGLVSGPYQLRVQANGESGTHMLAID